MRKSLLLAEQLQISIETELNSRLVKHQSQVRVLKSLLKAQSDSGQHSLGEPLFLLAQGDSWFDYPLSGNNVSLAETDVIAELATMGTVTPLILNLAHFGEATTDELSLPKQQRMISSLQNKSNWGSQGKPDAILFSGGGNDIAGNQFCIFLDYFSGMNSGLNVNRFEKALGMVEASYLDLFAFRDIYASGVPIIGHCYDFPIPNGMHPICAGPWLLPSLTYTGWNIEQGTQILKTALSELRSLLISLAAQPSNNFILIDTQGSLDSDDWANELHPFPAGFRKVATKFAITLQQKFPGRM